MRITLPPTIDRLTGKAGPLIVQRHPGGLYVKTARGRPSYATTAQQLHRQQISMLRHWWLNLPQAIRDYNQHHPYAPATNYYDRWLQTTRQEIAANQIPTLTPDPEFITGPRGFYIGHSGRPNTETAYWQTTGETTNRKICLIIGTCTAQYAYPTRLRTQGMDIYTMTKGAAPYYYLNAGQWYLALGFVHNITSDRYSKAVGQWFIGGQ